MKHIVSFLSVVLLCGSLFSQPLFYEDFQEVVLNSDGRGNIPSSWVLYNDANKPPSAFSYMDQAWKVLKESSSENVAVSLSWFSGVPRSADRWMITPEINLAETQNPYLLFKLKAVDAAISEKLQIRISLGDTNKLDFTDSLTSILTNGGEWAQYALPLTDYKGKGIRIAFILQTLDGYALCLDDVEISDFSKSKVDITEFYLPPMTGNAQPVEIKGKAINRSLDTLRSYTISYMAKGYLTSERVENLSVPFLGTFDFQASDFIPQDTGLYDFSMWFSDMNSSTGICTDTSKGQIWVSQQQYHSRVALMEVFTSSTCGPCAEAAPYTKKGLQAIGYNQVESKVIAIKYQMNIPSPGDPGVTDEGLSRGRYYQINGAPMFFMGGKTMSRSGGLSTLESIIPQNVEKIWADRTPFYISLSAVRSGGTFKVNANVSCMSIYENPLRLYVVFVEDSVYHSPQSNGEKEFFCMMRKIMPSDQGESLIFTSPEQEISKQYSYHFDTQKPIIFNGLQGISVVAFVQDEVTKEIMQAAIVPSVSVTVNKEYETLKSGNIALYPNPCMDKLYVSEPYSYLQIYDMQGRSIQTWQKEESTLDLKGYKAGMYIVKMKKKNGELKTSRLIIQ